LSAISENAIKNEMAGAGLLPVVFCVVRGGATGAFEALAIADAYHSTPSDTDTPAP
jgi:hypothetical protein